MIVPQPVTTPSPGMRRRVHAEVVAAVRHEHVELLEAALVEQDLEPLARGQLALGVLGLDAPLAAPEPGLAAAALELVEDILHRRSPARP